MTLRLVVDTTAWQQHVRNVAQAAGDILPVVKGNGYGFGRTVLMTHAAQLATQVAGLVRFGAKVVRGLGPVSVAVNTHGAMMPQGRSELNAI